MSKQIKKSEVLERCERHPKRLINASRILPSEWVVYCSYQRNYPVFSCSIIHASSKQKAITMWNAAQRALKARKK